MNEFHSLLLQYRRSSNHLAPNHLCTFFFPVNPYFLSPKSAFLILTVMTFHCFPTYKFKPFNKAKLSSYLLREVFFFLIIFYFLFLYWNIVDFQCINFCCRAKRFNNTHTHAHTHSFLYSFTLWLISQDTEYSSLCHTAPTPGPPLPHPPSPLATTSLFSMSVSLFLFCR